MNKLKLVHNSDKFLLEINDNKINFVSEYEIKANAEDRISLGVTLNIPIDMLDSSIDIENCNANLL